MSREIARAVLNLEPAPRPGRTEFCEQAELMARVSGVPADSPELPRRFAEAWDLDFLWLTNDGPIDWRQAGRITDMGHAVYAADGRDRRDAALSPFTDPEQVYAFDAVEEYGLPEMDELVAYYKKVHAEHCERNPNVLVPGGIYQTLVSGSITAFGWDMLLVAMADQERFDRVLETFIERSLHHVRAWAQTDIEYFICHDDMVWTSGPFVHPDFYRRAIMPRYKRLWEPLRETGKKVIYCSDGDWTMFLEDVVEAGADGFILEPVVPFETVCERYGKSHVIFGSAVDCRTLTFGTPEAILAEVDRSLAAGLGCPGWVAVVGNHIAPNVPVANALAYDEHLRGGWIR